jgi:Rrf2 family protein
MQLTRAADYAVRIMIHMAGLPPRTRANCAELSEAGEIPQSFVLKVLQSLVRAGFVESQRGAGGGFALATAPERVSLLDIVEAIEGPTTLNACLAAGPGCTRKPWCPAHGVWLEAQQAMTAVLRRATIAALAEQAAQQV